VVREFAVGAEGLIRLEEGHAGEARELLEEAFQKLRAYQHASPLIGAKLDKIHAALALACAAEGDIEAARRHYQFARPRLLALKHDDVIERCERAIGLTNEG
jgi:hypothetical protein